MNNEYLTEQGNNVFSFSSANFSDGIYTMIINHPVKYEIKYLLIKR